MYLLSLSVLLHYFVCVFCVAGGREGGYDKGGDLMGIIDTLRHSRGCVQIFEDWKRFFGILSFFLFFFFLSSSSSFYLFLSSFIILLISFFISFYFCFLTTAFRAVPPWRPFSPASKPSIAGTNGPRSAHHLFNTTHSIDIWRCA